MNQEPTQVDKNYAYVLSVKTMAATLDERDRVREEKNTELKAAKKEWAEKLTEVTKAIKEAGAAPKPKSAKARGEWIDELKGALAKHDEVEDAKEEDVGKKKASLKKAEEDYQRAETAFWELVKCDPGTEQLSLAVGDQESLLPMVSAETAAEIESAAAAFAETDESARELRDILGDGGFSAGMDDEGEGGDGEEEPLPDGVLVDEEEPEADDDEDGEPSLEDGVVVSMAR